MGQHVIFDISVGKYDGAEVSELIEIYIIYNLSTIMKKT